MKLLMVDSISRGGYFNFRNIDFRLLHSSVKRSGEDERRTVAIQTRSVIGERNNRSLVGNNGPAAENNGSYSI